ncbi:hypothetical protein Y032_0264g629 [Ancylostoma ceylanicum]|uniref:Uncharacterized protein n=1 Tax=Ancylostoma ceylanicum TaxID=53326 RepID=A0A016SAE3_9BILA|nr:hypothetical protein Y032_0264g629 [Ancylostoma ceylanicum]
MMKKLHYSSGNSATQRSRQVDSVQPFAIAIGIRLPWQWDHLFSLLRYAFWLLFFMSKERNFWTRYVRLFFTCA